MPKLITPVADELTEAFWAGAREGRLRLQRCGDCGHINHPPQVLCGWCASEALHSEDVNGVGQIASHTSELQRRGAQASESSTIIVVELDVQPGVYLVSDVTGPRPDWVSIGTRVRVRFDPLGDGDVVLPQFESDPEAA